jgi:hypothetical protein
MLSKPQRRNRIVAADIESLPRSDEVTYDLVGKRGTRKPLANLCGALRVLRVSESEGTLAGRGAAQRYRTMSAIVEMFREAGAPKGRNRFACPLPTWDLLWELGHAFGWHPEGTTYVMPARSTVDVPARRNYQPGGSRDHKRVEEEDAVGWARALEVAKASPHLAAMIEARSGALLGSGKTAGELLPGMLDEFIEFAYGGAFEFSTWSEETRDG